MRKIYVKTAFELQHGDQKLQFGVGNHTVGHDVASHWYVQHHIGEDPDAGQSADDQAADALLAELDGREQELREQLALFREAQGVLAEREKATEAREAALIKLEEAAKDKASELEKRDVALANAEAAVQAKAAAVDVREAALVEREKAVDTKAESTKTSKK